MYAQLCKRLSEEAPNLEPPDQPCTFKLLLLNKCRAEFENRAQAFAAFEERALVAPAPDDDERRHLAKCKMLGNIKFIGELGKLEILAESILHRCIQNLLARRAADEHQEDLECLAQLVRTCGRVLDSERGRGLMDQYFARIETLSQSRDLAPRIRFMLRDVAELRRGGWVPRAATSAEGPVPIQQLRDDSSPPRRERGHAERDPLFRAARPRPLDDVLAGLALQPPAPLHTQDKLFGNGFAPRDAFRAPRSAPGYYRQPAHYKQSAAPPAKPGKRPPAPAPAGAGALHDVQMRPAANSLLFTATRLSRETQPPPLHHNVLSSASFAPAPTPLKEPPLSMAIKPAPDAKNKPKKDKGATKEEACRVAAACVSSLAEAYAGGARVPDDDELPEELDALLQPLRDLQLPDKVLRRACGHVLDAASDADPSVAWSSCRVVRAVRRAAAAETLRAIAGSGGGAVLLAHAVRLRLCTLAELGAWCEGGQHALLLQVLQELKAQLGMERLAHLYAESKMNLHAVMGIGGAEGVAGACADAGGALDALEARGLGALVPQLRVQAALARQLAAEPSPHHLYRWIKSNVEPAVRGDAAFVSALVVLVARHVTAAAGSAAAQSDKAALEREKALAESYAPLLTALLEGRADLQLAAVYAAQLHAHEHRYPKGMLLRWFMYLYNLEVCEEDAFLRWREDVTDQYPGKGEALFQVNAWLTWLQQQESEDEEAED